MKADRKRLKAEKTDLVSQMQQLYATLESREEQLRDFIRNYEQHRKVSWGEPSAGIGWWVALGKGWGGCWQRREHQTQLGMGQRLTEAPASWKPCVGWTTRG